MKVYLDTSALVKLYVAEEGSALVRGATERAELTATSALAYVEARAAFVRRRHEGTLTRDDYRRILQLLDADWTGYAVLQIAEGLIRESARLAERHRLRAYDAVHLASASAIRDRTGGPVAFACWDRPLERAAKREGFESLRTPGSVLRSRSLH